MDERNEEGRELLAGMLQKKPDESEEDFARRVTENWKKFLALYARDERNEEGRKLLAGMLQKKPDESEEDFARRVTENWKKFLALYARDERNEEGRELLAGMLQKKPDESEEDFARRVTENWKKFLALYARELGYVSKYAYWCGLGNICDREDVLAALYALLLTPGKIEGIKSIARWSVRTGQNLVRNQFRVRNDAFTRCREELPEHLQAPGVRKIDYMHNLEVTILRRFEGFRPNDRGEIIAEWEVRTDSHVADHFNRVASVLFEVSPNTLAKRRSRAWNRFFKKTAGLASREEIALVLEGLYLKGALFGCIKGLSAGPLVIGRTGWINTAVVLRRGEAVRLCASGSIKVNGALCSPKPSEKTYGVVTRLTPTADPTIGSAIIDYVDRVEISLSADSTWSEGRLWVAVNTMQPFQGEFMVSVSGKYSIHGASFEGSIHRKPGPSVRRTASSAIRPNDSQSNSRTPSPVPQITYGEQS